MPGRTLVMGDIHGNLKAYDQCMERCAFDADNDTLIQLGDVSDRLPDTAFVVEKLLKLKNLVAIRGNHDEWTRRWFVSDLKDPTWVANGGQETLDSYHEAADVILEDHRTFFENTQINFYVDLQQRIYVHGGFTHPKGPDFDVVKDQCLWDRSLWNEAMLGEKLVRKPDILKGFQEIYIGHTPTLNWFQDAPMNIFNVWNMDTGAGHPNGRLTIMDVDTKEYWQSEVTNTLYDV